MPPQHPDPTDLPDWPSLVGMALAGDWPGLFGAVEQRQQRSADGLAVLFKVLQHLLYSGHPDLLAEAWTQVDRNNLMAVVVLFLQGCAMDALGEHDAGWSNIRNASAAAHRFGDLFNTCAELRSILTMGPNVVTGAEWDGAMGRFPTADPGPHSHETPILLTCCDPTYLVKYAPAFARSTTEHAQGLPLHFHVMGEDDECRAAWDAIAPAMPPCEQSFGPAPANGTVGLACGRFLLAHDVMARNRRPVVVTDIDAVLATGFKACVAEAQRADLALFGQPDSFPWLRWAAGFVYLNHTDAGLRLARALAHLAEIRLAGRVFWFFDQCLLAAMVNGADRHGYDILDLSSTGRQLLADALLATGDHDIEVEWKWKHRKAGAHKGDHG